LGMKHPRAYYLIFVKLAESSRAAANQLRSVGRP
jgi:hypothetical protein